MLEYVSHNLAMDWIAWGFILSSVGARKDRYVYVVSLLHAARRAIAAAPLLFER